MALRALLTLATPVKAAPAAAIQPLHPCPGGIPQRSGSENSGAGGSSGTAGSSTLGGGAVITALFSAFASQSSSPLAIVSRRKEIKRTRSSALSPTRLPADIWLSSSMTGSTLGGTSKPFSRRMVSQSSASVP